MSAARASYRAAGVDYEALDAGKRLAMAARAVHLAAAAGARWARARRLPRRARVRVRARRADVRVRRRGARHEVDHRPPRARVAWASTASRDVAYDAVAAILNDLACVGALPLVANAYFATGASAWYAQRERAEALLEGWRRACEDAGCVWGGGESPSLPGLLDEQEIELAGAAVGAVPEGRAPLLGEELRAGDEIVLVASSGLHANGASLARLVAERLHDGYATRCPTARRFGEALLAPSIMYVPLVAALLQDSAVERQLHQPRHRPRPAEADAPAAAAHLPRRTPPAGSLRCSSSSSPRRGSRRRPRTRRSTWAAATRSTAAREGAGRWSPPPPGSGSTGDGRGTRRGGSAAGDPRAGRRPLRGLASSSSPRAERR